METKTETQVEKLVVNAIVFIIPNSLVDLSTETDEGYISRMKDMQIDLNLVHSNKLVQVWVANVECDNFNCSPMNPVMEVWESKRGLNRYKFPSHLPISLCEGKKEGEIVVIDTEEAKVNLKLNQLDYRYSSFGKFEEVLSKLKGN